MSKVYVKVDNVFFASRWFGNKYGSPKEGEITVSVSKLFARQYDSVDIVIRDARLLGVPLDRLTIVKVA